MAMRLPLFVGGSGIDGGEGGSTLPISRCSCSSPFPTDSAEMASLHGRVARELGASCCVTSSCCLDTVSKCPVVGVAVGPSCAREYCGIILLVASPIRVPRGATCCQLIARHVTTCTCVQLQRLRAGSASSGGETPRAIRISSAGHPRHCLRLVLGAKTINRGDGLRSKLSQRR